MLLAGKTAIVTGASRGIGRAIALAYAREGANVVLAARHETNPALSASVFEVSKEITARGGRSLPVELDLRNSRAVRGLVAATVKEFSGVDILVNNAAVNLRGSVASMKLRHWDLVFAVNLRAILVTSQLVLPSMRARGGGHILNISSIAADGVHPGVVPYSAAKAALERLSTGLAMELADDRIAVVVLKPRGVVATPGVQVLRGEGQVQADPPEFMAEAAVVLASAPIDACSGNIYTDAEALKAYGREDLFARMQV